MQFVQDAHILVQFYHWYNLLFSFALVNSKYHLFTYVTYLNQRKYQIVWGVILNHNWHAVQVRVISKKSCLPVPGIPSYPCWSQETDCLQVLHGFSSTGVNPFKKINLFLQNLTLSIHHTHYTCLWKKMMLKFKTSTEYNVAFNTSCKGRSTTSLD